MNLTSIHHTSVAQDINSVFAANLKRITKEKGMTQQALADKVCEYFNYPSFSYQQIQKYMAAKNKAAFIMAVALSKILDCKLDDFVDTHKVFTSPLPEHGEILSKANIVVQE